MDVMKEGLSGCSAKRKNDITSGDRQRSADDNTEPLYYVCLCDRHRLADTKEGVRVSARACIATLSSCRAAAPRAILARLTPALGHKAAHTREEALTCIGTLLHELVYRSQTDTLTAGEGQYHLRCSKVTFGLKTYLSHAQ